jgi:AraC-like DNA-binding protein
MTLHAEITSHSRGDRLFPHRHARAYVALILDGAYSELSADGAWVCEPGDVVIHPPHHLHANSFKGRTKVLNLQIPVEYTGCREFRSYSVVRPACVDEVRRAMNDPGALRQELCNAMPVGQQHPDDWVDFMAKDLTENTSIRIAELARKYSVTHEHASRVFRKRYFMTPSEFRSESRFRRALNLLRERQRSLSEIAQVAGYSDQPHFSREFQKITGTSPGKLRGLQHRDQACSRPVADDGLDCS